MVEGRGTPLVTYVTLRQMRKFEIGYAEAKQVKMSTIQNVRAICQLENAIRQGIPLNQAILDTHSVTYATASIIQSGGRIASARVEGGVHTEFTELLEHYEGSGRGRDMAAVTEHRNLLTQYGIARDDTVLWNYNIHLEIVPFS